MKPSFSLLLAILSGLILMSVPSAKAKSAMPASKAEFAKRLTGNIENLEQFEKIATEAKATGLSNQVILEAKLVFCIKTDTVAPLAELLPRVEQILPEWKEEESLFFKERYQLEGALHLAHGVLAASTHDDQTFEREMKDAFWTDPQLSPAVSERILAFRAKQAMGKVVLPMSLSFETSNGEKTTLGELVKGQKALLLDFWASWCSPCMALMDDLRKRSDDLAPKGIRVVGMNTESDRNKAEKVRKDRKMSMAWLVEPKDEPLSRPLKIDSIPRAVLVTPDGKIAFSGHPQDAELQSALASLGIK
jgi:thiol-disulfide isomerase/thioredoxin